MPTFEIYCHTCTVNGKKYVGQTAHGMLFRWKQHVRESRRPERHVKAIHRAIRKYGADAFTHEVLETCDAQDSANASESKWIVTVGSLVPNGYNLTTGGDSFQHHEQAIAKMRAAQGARMAAMSAAEKGALADRMRSMHTPERQLAAARKGGESAKARAALMSPKERADKMAAVSAHRTPEGRARSIAGMLAAAAARTPEERRALWEKGSAKYIANRDPVEVREHSAKMLAARNARPFAERSASAKKSAATRRTKLA